MKAAVYISAEDSSLLRGALGGRSGGVSLEIGAGNGGTLKELAGSFRLTVGTDLLLPDMKDWARRGADFVLADRAGCFRDGTFDLVAFNPPYVPSVRVVDAAVDDGGDARVPMEFLREALRVVKDTGQIVMILSSAGDVRKFRESCKKRGFEMVELGRKHLFYEELAVYEARKAPATSDRHADYASSLSD